MPALLHLMACLLEPFPRSIHAVWTTDLAAAASTGNSPRCTGKNTSHCDSAVAVSIGMIPVPAATAVHIRHRLMGRRPPPPLRTDPSSVGHTLGPTVASTGTAASRHTSARAEGS